MFIAGDAHAQPRQRTYWHCGWLTTEITLPVRQTKILTQEDPQFPGPGHWQLECGQVCLLAEAHSARSDRILQYPVTRALSERRTLPEGETATSQYEIMYTRRNRMSTCVQPAVAIVLFRYDHHHSDSLPVAGTRRTVSDSPGLLATP
jgi:hypothetical protein